MTCVKATIDLHVSILVVLSKVFESIIADQLINYFNPIFNVMLCAYRKRYGCEHILIKLIESWKFALYENKFAGTIMMDLSKAFDCIPHGLLIAKLKAYGLSDCACKFMSSYLSGRFQRVKIKDARSEWLPLKKGIPQGSCLGPLLFNIFINDLFCFIEKCELENYADDNSLNAIAHSIELVMEALTHDTKNALKWFDDNFMQANPGKFPFMLLKSVTCHDAVPEFICINDVTIERQHDVKQLGITIDDKLKFDKHVQNLCKKAAKQLNVLYRFKSILDQKAKEMIYNTFILANFNYCPIVWHFCGRVSTRKMERIQERALRFLYNDTTSEYRDLLDKTGYDSLHLRRIKTIACEVFKCLFKLSPEFINELFKPKEVNYDLRNNSLLMQPNFKKIRYGKNTFQYYGAHLWNILPNDVKKCMDLKSFKIMLKSWEGPSNKCQCNMCEEYVLE